MNGRECYWCHRKLDSKYPIAVPVQRNGYVICSKCERCDTFVELQLATHENLLKEAIDAGWDSIEHMLNWKTTEDEVIKSGEYIQIWDAEEPGFDETWTPASVPFMTIINGDPVTYDLIPAFKSADGRVFTVLDNVC